MSPSSIIHAFQQALVVSQELIRVAILWHELWHERLEEASRLYFVEHNPEGMIAALEPLHDMLDAVSLFLYLHINSDCGTGTHHCSGDFIRASVR